MTADELAELEARANDRQASPKHAMLSAVDVPALVAEVRRLAAEVERLRGLIKSHETERHATDSGHEFMCPWCGMERPSSGDAYKGEQPHTVHCEAFTPDGRVR